MNNDELLEQAMQLQRQQQQQQSQEIDSQPRVPPPHIQEIEEVQLLSQEEAQEPIPIITKPDQQAEQ